MTASRARSAGAPGRPAPTASVEDYLKAIYSIAESGEPAGTNEIAVRLELSPASVSGMVRRLASQGLLAYKRYRGVRLTAAGRRVALRTLRRHRVIESYLVQELGYGWDGVHEEAERMEHSASDELVNRMASAIGEPLTDPHGAPIPTPEGRVLETRAMPLSDAAVGYRGRIVRVRDEDPAMLRYLGALALRPGALVRVKSRSQFGGPVTVVIGKANHSLGMPLAKNVLVTADDRMNPPA